MCEWFVLSFAAILRRDTVRLAAAVALVLDRCGWGLGVGVVLEVLGATGEAAIIMTQAGKIHHLSFTDFLEFVQAAYHRVFQAGFIAGKFIQGPVVAEIIHNRLAEQGFGVVLLIQGVSFHLGMNR